jgi:hypothetical protein
MQGERSPRNAVSGTGNSTETRGDGAWWLGVLLVSVGWWIGPLVANWIPQLEFLAEVDPRLGLSAFGMLLITAYLGQAAQSRWSADSGWSPRVIGHAIGSLAAGTITTILYAMWLVGFNP